MNHQKFVATRRLRRSRRVRKRARGTPERPRLTVFRSHKHIYAQLIDDETGQTLCAASSRDKKYGGNKTAAAEVGKAVASSAQTAGIKQVAFDRGGYRYHGRVAALADAAREAGLEF